MNLSGRLKQARVSLSYTQKEMANAVSVSAQMWQAYEAGRSVPGGNVLEALARLGINLNWLLTGEGEMRRAFIFEPAPNPGGPMAEKFRKIRGDIPILDFVKRLVSEEEDIKQLEDEIKAIEDGRIQPSWMMISSICYEFGISPTWIIEDEGPMLKKDACIGQGVVKSNIIEVNTDILKEILNEAEVYESVNPGSLSPEKKAELIAELYAMRAVKGK